MQGNVTRDKADAALAEILDMFQSGHLPDAVAQTRIVRVRHDRPLCDWSLGNQILAFVH